MNHNPESWRHYLTSARLRPDQTGRQSDPHQAFHKSGAGGNNGQYDPTFTNIPQPEPSHARDDWKPIVGTPFIEGSRAGDDGIRRVLEMVSAAVVPK